MSKIKYCQILQREKTNKFTVSLDFCSINCDTPQGHGNKAASFFDRLMMHLSVYVLI